jgi:hypothetical protein
LADRGLVAHRRRLVRDHLRKIDVEPAEGSGKVEPPRTRIEAGRQIDHGVHAAIVDAIEDHLVEHRGADDHRPRQLPAALQLAHDLQPALAGQTLGERIAEDGVGASGLHGAVDRDPSRRVGYVADRHDQDFGSIVHPSARCTSVTRVVSQS